jgi:2-desacetyl-2-hydroxyethyl bacteriochlorophyllide A dehydrogenase
MSQASVITGPKQIIIQAETDKALEPQQVRVKTLFSGISAGTELTAFRGSNPFMSKHWDEERKLFTTSEKASATYPFHTWGYEEVGEVIEIGSVVKSVKVGDKICGAWSHRTHAVLSEDDAKNNLMPEVDPVLGIFAKIGAIALNGVHGARIRIGETVAVFGLGVPGQIVAQLAKRSGAFVVGVDPILERRELAKTLGATDEGIDPQGAAEKIRDLTSNRGADVSVEVSGSSLALQEAIRATAYSAKVIAMGFYQGEAKGLYLGEEFHHNRVNVVASQIFGVDPELNYRWNETRLSQTIMRLQANGTLNLKPLISHRYPFAEIQKAFELLDANPKDVMQTVLEF